MFHNITKFDTLLAVMKTKIIFNCEIEYNLKSQQKIMRTAWFHESSSRLIIHCFYIVYLSFSSMCSWLLGFFFLPLSHYAEYLKKKILMA